MLDRLAIGPLRNAWTEPTSQLSVVTGSHGALPGWIPRRDNRVVPGARICDQRCCATTPSTYGGARHANKPERCATTSSTYVGANLGIVRRCPVPMVNLSWKFTVDLSIELWELPTKMTELGSSGSYLSWASPQLGSWTCRGLPVGHPPELGGYAPKRHGSWRRLLARRLSLWVCPLGSCGRAGPKGCIAWDGGCKMVVTRWRLFLAVGVSRDTPVHRASSRKTRQQKERMGSARVLCDNVQYLCWYKLGHCATMSSTYGGTNLGDVRHHPAPMNLSWKFTMDLSVELWELPTKMTKLARGATSVGHHLSWLWRQLDMPWAVSWPTNRAGWLRPQETCLLEAPLGEAPFPLGVPFGHLWEGWAERVHCLGWRLQDGGYKVIVVLGSWCVKRHTHSSCLFKEDKAVQGEDGQRFLLKRCASWDAPFGEKTHLFTC
ncbi:LOW QUALITY PROTEIN: hypothetical protein Cgig2_025567 [Carnegiea gigantea]|uniref:Uncharacterized protein n=1 Tax=Carnegiea gigantea TaxID=171969 RepID=A0A9Q1JLL7_9CARY|nr:LOW QUALITY PROTEIN: hypothetical protein Cgig2_025567 [Carnegiea gigantea]